MVVVFFLSLIQLHLHLTLLKVNAEFAHCVSPKTTQLSAGESTFTQVLLIHFHFI